MSVLAGMDSLELTPPVGAGELSGARIHRILDRVGWPGGDKRDVAAGQVPMQATNLARNLADEAGVTADSEGGSFFMGADPGVAVFRDRDWWRTTAPGPPSWWIGNTTGANLCPTGWEVTYQMDDVVSVVSLSNAGGTVRQYIDGAAYSQFGPASYRRYDLMCATDAMLDTLAGRILAVKARAGPRVRAVTVSLLGDPRLAAFITGTGCAFGQRIRCSLTLEDGAPFDRVMLATQYSHQITPDDWLLRIGLEDAAPYAPAQPWGVARYGAGTWSSAL